MAEIDKENGNENTKMKKQYKEEPTNEHEKDQKKESKLNPSQNGEDEKSNQICLSDFILQNQIGMGSFGKVFKVKEKKTKKIYAAKVSIQEINEITNESIINLISEVNIISKLHHPSILEYIGYSPINFKNKRKPVIITEYAPNGSLLDLIELDRSTKTNNKWDFTQKLICIYGIASAMSYLHQHDIIHRDLKPENILIDSFLFPKIADFGLSKIKQVQKNSLDQSTKTIKGTPIYISPEIWKKYEYSKAGDVYAFGIIMYEIVTKERPFSDVNIFQILMMIQNGYRPQFKNLIPSSYRQLIELCWSEDPKDRPSFSQITERLKSDKRFIIDSVDEEKFQKYVKFIDESKVSFDSSKNDINKDDLYKLFKQVNRDNESDNEKIEIIRRYSNTIKICPLNFYLSLNDECKKKIEELEKDLNYIEISKCLIEGYHPFERNIEVGMKYLKIAVKSGNVGASVYYFNHLLKGEIIPRNFKKARKIIENINNEDKSLFYYMEGKLYTKECNYEKALESFKKSAELNNIDSLYEYGKLLLEGKGTTVNEIEGLKYIKESAEKGSIHGMYKYGKLLIEGKKVPKDEPKGHEYVKKAVEHGDSKILYYYSTLIEEEDKEKSNEYLKESAYKGYTEAMYQYALNLPNEPQYRAENILFFKKASEKGHNESLYQYSLFLEDSNDAEIKKKIVKYYRIAAYNGNIEALNHYAVCLFKGLGIECDKEEAVKYLKIAADKGSMNAMYNYGYCLLNGEGVDVDAKESEKYLKMSIEKGYTLAMIFYAQMLYDGNGITENKEESAKYYKMAADKGNVKSMGYYALLLLQGKVVEYNKEEGFKYLNKAIENGYNYGYHLYGRIYDEGVGVEVDKKEAIKYFKIAADKGVTESMNKYATMLYLGDGIQQNKEEAFNYFKCAADNGNNHAMNKYAQCVLVLNDSGIDIEEAMKYYKMSADDGNLEGLFNYGVISLFDNNIERQKKVILFMKDRSVQKTNEMDDKVIQSLFIETLNDEKAEINPIAFKYIEKAANYGHINAMRILGLIYLNKKSIKNGEAKAAKYFKMAADKGEVDSMRDYGLMCYYGIGIPENIDESLKYLQMAIRKGDSRSAYNYALIHFEGTKVSKDIQTAIKCLKIASDLGHLDATINLAKILFDAKNEEAFKYYKIAADRGSVVSIFNCGYMLENGILIPVDKKEAFKCYKSAASKGSNEAVNKYAEMIYKSEVETIENEKEELLKYLEIVDVNNDGSPMNEIGDMLYFGNVVPSNKEEAMKYYKLAIEKGNGPAMANLAYMFELGDGVPVDFEKALKYYKMAIEKEEPVAFNNYAYMLENGEGVPVNKEEALKYYKIGSDKGVPASMYHYGKMLHYGEGIECNKIEAIKYYKMAIENGNIKAKEELEKLLKEFENDKIIESEN